MINNVSIVLLMLGYFVFLYFFTDYLKKKFAENMKGFIEDYSLVFIINSFMSILFFGGMLMQNDDTVGTALLGGWIAWNVLFFSPFIYLIIVGVFKNFVTMFREKKGIVEENDIEEHY